MLLTTITTLTTLLLASTSMALPSTPSTGAIATSIEMSLDALDAANSTAATDPLAKREPNHLPSGHNYVYKKVRYCQHANGGGACIEQLFRHGLCYNFDPWWNNRISSIYPDRNFRCRMHDQRDCRGGSRDVGPNWNIPDLKNVQLNDKMSSIDCYGQGA